MSLSTSSVSAVAAVSDIDRARNFYEEKLGLVPQDDASEMQVYYECGGDTGILIYVSPTQAGSGAATLAFWNVDDLRKEMESLGSAGVEFERYDEPGLKTDESGVFDTGDELVAWFKDPDGNTLGIGQG
jgi:catechol 2,3-dioxygenase-like lactoylglutathione lyase family enzyme